MRVLVTGGAGYIGSHTCVELLEAGHEVFVIDNLCNGHEAALERVRGITKCELQFIIADIRDTIALDKIFNSFKPDSVIHFAGLKAVGESVADPLRYYDVNIGGSISLLRAMSKAGCNNIVFSSSATVYGKPEYLPYDEEHPTNPVNPYGRSKLTIEIIINDWIKINAERKGTILRYFNPVGAHESGMIGEEPNGTAERDFIHVMDLASAHVKSLERKNDLKRSEILNIGRGTGVTVLELIKNFESASGKKINYNFLPRRSGDLPSFWANSTKAFKLLNWKANISIYEICQDTWRWQSNNLNGYDG